MRFKTFLQENQTFRNLEEIVAEIKKDCQPYLSQIEHERKGMMRGFHGAQRGYYERPTNRHPRDTTPLFNFMFDVGFIAAFGIQDVRTKTVFATGDEKNARVYGDLSFVFPKGEFEFYWSRTIGDVLDFDYYFYRSIVRNLIQHGFKPDVEHPTDNDDIRMGREVWQKLWVKGVWSRDILNGKANATIQKELGVTSEALVAACKETFQDYYRNDDLGRAIESGNEIMITKSDGYYMIPASDIPGKTALDKFNALKGMLFQ
jgi:hypothetical protein